MAKKAAYWLLWKPRRTNRNNTYKCTHCEKLCSSYYNDVGAWKYCPHCGKRMYGPISRRQFAEMKATEEVKSKEETK